MAIVLTRIVSFFHTRKTGQRYTNPEREGNEQRPHIMHGIGVFSRKIHTLVPQMWTSLTGWIP